MFGKMFQNKQAKSGLIWGSLGTIIILALVPPAYNPVTMLADIFKGFFKDKKKPSQP
jgi:hypothetical protein